ncbi:hypothetical protein P3342_001082 [Pyrenophora teres f. teres]|nr:hypothetical protein P3342_001082 [Pyrenophora teres f. teres]
MRRVVFMRTDHHSKCSSAQRHIIRGWMRCSWRAVKDEQAGQQDRLAHQAEELRLIDNSRVHMTPHLAIN